MPRRISPRPCFSRTNRKPACATCRSTQTLALVGSIVGEFIGGNKGVGYLVLSAQFNLDTPLVFATLLSITLFTTLGIGLITLFESRFLKWRPSQRTR